jgi:hypothetical protein
MSWAMVSASMFTLLPGALHQGKSSAATLSQRIFAPLSLRPRKYKALAPTTNIASVARRNGAPRMAPMPISPAVSGSRPANTAARMATTGIMVSGSAVPTAASTLPTAPWPRFSRPPRISTA